MSKGAYLHNLADLELTRMVQEATKRMTAPKEPDTNREQIEDILTLEEVAKYLRVHPTTIYRLMKKSAPHRLPAFRIGNGWRFARESVLAWRKEEEAAR